MKTSAVLIVEDEAVIALDLQDMLEAMGCVVPAIAATAEEALAAVERHRPDLVLLDIHLSDGSDGVAVATSVRARWQVPVIFLTAHTDGATLGRIAATEPVALLIKPFSEHDVVQAVSHALAQSQANSPTRRATEREGR